MNKGIINLSEFKFDDLALGNNTKFSLSIDKDMLEDFSKLSGDSNPLHMDKNYASETPLNGNIVHGLLAGSLFSRLVGMHLPGKYALYLSQNMRFCMPIRLDQEITVEGTIIQKVDSMMAIKISTKILDAHNSDILIDGEAMVKLLK